jgi:hypothetical protein
MISTGNTPKALLGASVILPSAGRTVSAGVLRKLMPKIKRPKAKETLPAYCGGRPQAFRADGR